MDASKLDAIDALSMACDRSRAALYLLEDLDRAVNDGMAMSASCGHPDSKDKCFGVLRDEVECISIALSDMMTSIAANAEKALALRG